MLLYIVLHVSASDSNKYYYYYYKALEKSAKKPINFKPISFLT